MNPNDQKDYNQQMIEQFRASWSKPGGPMEGSSMLLLTTTGAKSGQPRTTPMMYISDGDRLIVLASNAGAVNHPDWYHNLVAHPQVTVEARGETLAATATVTAGAERQHLWDMVVAQYPSFSEHQAKITRQIPLILLSRQEGGPDV